MAPYIPNIDEDILLKAARMVSQHKQLSEERSVLKDANATLAKNVEKLSDDSLRLQAQLKMRDGEMNEQLEDNRRLNGEVAQLRRQLACQAGKSTALESSASRPIEPLKAAVSTYAQGRATPPLATVARARNSIPPDTATASKVDVAENLDCPAPAGLEHIWKLAIIPHELQKEVSRARKSTIEAQTPGLTSNIPHPATAPRNMAGPDNRLTRGYLSLYPPSETASASPPMVNELSSRPTTTTTSPRRVEPTPKGHPAAKRNAAKPTHRSRAAAEQITRRQSRRIRGEEPQLDIDRIDYGISLIKARQPLTPITNRANGLKVEKRQVPWPQPDNATVSKKYRKL
ncbi:hypothetical protein K461DRAFT_318430 [Myriangium duriaei CBS 260.36]|uniref:Uncharacterized protein n=1 Tax=Myriangium duriaei CBS 260.36 TaxID=1168546 RepID=A0A9P4J6Q7_9PEZI|nr:hypothetical protein K461DRAFT_318430 [Myriangium duriaei CBS 260.36]